MRDARQIEILQAAKEVFETAGMDASVAAIAKHAGTGISAFYHRFPTKTVLIETLALEALINQASRWEKALASEDAWTGFVEAILAFAATMHDCPSLAASLRTPINSLPQFGELIAERDRNFSLVMSRAKADGRMRPDLEMHDIRRMFEAIRQLQFNSERRYGDGWERLLLIMLDGFKSRPDAEKLSEIE